MDYQVERVRAVVRVRGYNRSDETIISEDDPKAVVVKTKAGDGSVNIRSRSGKDRIEFKFDAVFAQENNQEDVYSYIGQFVSGVSEGMNTTIFAYGQTGTGKTHTMLGVGLERFLLSKSISSSEFENDSNEDIGWGVIPRSVKDLFMQLNENSSFQTVTVLCSYMQIYQDRLYDLLTDGRMQRPLPIREGTCGTNKDGFVVSSSALPTTVQNSIYHNNNHNKNESGVYVPGLSQCRVSSIGDVLSLLARGAHNRAERATEYNLHSSRSHAILQLQVEVEEKVVDTPKKNKRKRPLPFKNNDSNIGENKQQEKIEDKNVIIHNKTEGHEIETNDKKSEEEAKNVKDEVEKEEMVEIRRAKLTLVDLAGSEKWGDGAAGSRDLSKELTSINTSLSALGNCIAALAEKGRKHVPFRDSSLTRLLQDSLGGNTRTVVIATVSPHLGSLEETASTLTFANRASQITAKVHSNHVMTESSLLSLARKEIASLKLKLLKNDDDQSVLTKIHNHCKNVFHEKLSKNLQEPNDSPRRKEIKSRENLENEVLKLREKVLGLEQKLSVYTAMNITTDNDLEQNHISSSTSTTTNLIQRSIPHSPPQVSPIIAQTSPRTVASPSSHGMSSRRISMNSPRISSRRASLSSPLQSPSRSSIPLQSKCQPIKFNVSSTQPPVSPVSTSQEVEDQRQSKIIGDNTVVKIQSPVTTATKPPSSPKVTVSSSTPTMYGNELTKPDLVTQLNLSSLSSSTLVVGTSTTTPHVSKNEMFESGQKIEPIELGQVSLLSNESYFEVANESKSNVIDVKDDDVANENRIQDDDEEEEEDSDQVSESSESDLDADTLNAVYHGEVPKQNEMKCIAKSIYDFNGEEEGDLSFQVGKLIVVIERSDSGWWKGYHYKLHEPWKEDINKKNNDELLKVGTFPCHYVEVLPEDKAHLLFLENPIDVVKSHKNNTSSSDATIRNEATTSSAMFQSPPTKPLPLPRELGSTSVATMTSNGVQLESCEDQTRAKQQESDKEESKAGDGEKNNILITKNAQAEDPMELIRKALQVDVTDITQTKVFTPDASKNTEQSKVNVNLKNQFDNVDSKTAQRNSESGDDSDENVDNEKDEKDEDDEGEEEEKFQDTSKEEELSNSSLGIENSLKALRAAAESRAELTANKGSKKSRVISNSLPSNSPMNRNQWKKEIWRGDVDGSGLLGLQEFYDLIRLQLGCDQSTITDKDIALLFHMLENLNSNEDDDEIELSSLIREIEKVSSSSNHSTPSKSSSSPLTKLSDDDVNPSQDKIIHKKMTPKDNNMKSEENDEVEISKCNLVQTGIKSKTDQARSRLNIEPLSQSVSNLNQTNEKISTKSFLSGIKSQISDEKKPKRPSKSKNNTKFHVNEIDNKNSKNDEEDVQIEKKLKEGQRKQNDLLPEQLYMDEKIRRIDKHPKDSVVDHDDSLMKISKQNKKQLSISKKLHQSPLLNNKVQQKVPVKKSESKTLPIPTSSLNANKKTIKQSNKSDSKKTLPSNKKSNGKSHEDLMRKKKKATLTAKNDVDKKITILKQNSKLRNHISPNQNEKKLRGKMKQKNENENNEEEGGGGGGRGKIIWLEEGEEGDDDNDGWVKRHLQQRQVSDTLGGALSKQVSPIQNITADIHQKITSPQPLDFPKLKKDRDNSNHDDAYHQSVSEAQQEPLKFPPLNTSPPKQQLNHHHEQQPQQQQMEENTDRCPRHGLLSCVLCSMRTNKQANPPTPMSERDYSFTPTSSTLPDSNATIRCDRHGLLDCVLCSGLIKPSKALSSSTYAPSMMISGPSSIPADSPSFAPLSRMASNQSPANCDRHGLQDCFLCSLASRSKTTPVTESNVLNEVGSENSSEADEAEYVKYKLSSIRTSTNPMSHKSKKISNLSPYKTTINNSNHHSFSQHYQQEQHDSFTTPHIDDNKRVGTFDEAVIGGTALEALRAAHSILSGEFPG